MAVFFHRAEISQSRDKSSGAGIGVNRLWGRGLGLLLAVVLLVPGARLAFGDIYRYVDENGVVHFSNVPTNLRYRLYFPEAKMGIKAYFTRYDRIIEQASRRHGVDSSLVKAVIKAESDYNRKAVSKAGAEGLMQLMPETAKDLAVTDSFDPNENIHAGVRYLKEQLNSFDNNVPLALAAYNAGETTVRKYGRIPPYKETKTFVERVLRYWDEYNSHRHKRQ
jgi:soluble lytic murein transglycosylase-like protein